MHGLAEPLLETDLAEPRAGGWHERAFAEHGAEVARLRVGHHFAGVLTSLEPFSNELVEPKLLWTGDFDNVVDGLAGGDPADGLGDVVSGHRLDEHRGKADSLAISGRGRDALHELEELRRVHDRYGIDDSLISCSCAVFARK